MTSHSRRINVTTRVSKDTLIPVLSGGSVFGDGGQPSPQIGDAPVWNGGELHPSWQQTYAKAGIAFPQGNPYQWIMQQAVEKKRRRKIRSMKMVSNQWHNPNHGHVLVPPVPQVASDQLTRFTQNNQYPQMYHTHPSIDDRFNIPVAVQRQPSAVLKRRRRLPRQYAASNYSIDTDTETISSTLPMFELEHRDVSATVTQNTGRKPSIEAVQLNEDKEVIRKAESIIRRSQVDDDLQRRVASLEVVETERRLTLLMQERTQMQRIEAEFRVGLTQVVMNLQRIVVEKEAEIKRHSLRRAEHQKFLLQTAVLSASLIRDEFEERRNLVIQEVEFRSILHDHRDKRSILLLQKHELEITEIHHRELVVFQEQRHLEFVVGVSAILSEEAEMRLCVVEQESEHREDIEHSRIQTMRIWKLLKFDRTHLVIKDEAQERMKIRVLEELRRQWLHRIDDLSQHEHELRTLIRKRERDEWIDIVQTAKRMKLFVDTSVVGRSHDLKGQSHTPLRKLVRSDVRSGDPSFAYVGDFSGVRSRYSPPNVRPHVDFNLENNTTYYPYSYINPYIQFPIHSVIPPPNGYSLPDDVAEWQSSRAGRHTLTPGFPPLADMRSNSTHQEAYDSFLQSYFSQSLGGGTTGVVGQLFPFEESLGTYLPQRGHRLG